MNKLQQLYKTWCKDTQRNGGVLTGKSLDEFFEYATPLLNEQPTTEPQGLDELIKKYAELWRFGFQPIEDTLKKAMQDAQALVVNDVEAYRGALGYAVPSSCTGKLSNGERPRNGIAEALERMLAAKEQELAEAVTERNQLQNKLILTRAEADGALSQMLSVRDDYFACGKELQELREDALGFAEWVDRGAFQTGFPKVTSWGVMGAEKYFATTTELFQYWKDKVIQKMDSN